MEISRDKEFRAKVAAARILDKVAASSLFEDDGTFPRLHTIEPGENLSKELLIHALLDYYKEMSDVATRKNFIIIRGSLPQSKASAKRTYFNSVPVLTNFSRIDEFWNRKIRTRVLSDQREAFRSIKEAILEAVVNQATPLEPANPPHALAAHVLIARVFDAVQLEVAFPLPWRVRNTLATAATIQELASTLEGIMPKPTPRTVSAWTSSLSSRTTKQRASSMRKQRPKASAPRTDSLLLQQLAKAASSMQVSAAAMASASTGGAVRRQPERFKRRAAARVPSTTTSQTSREGCWVCGEQDHLARNCPNKLKAKRQRATGPDEGSS